MTRKFECKYYCIKEMYLLIYIIYIISYMNKLQVIDLPGFVASAEGTQLNITGITRTRIYNN